MPSLWPRHHRYRFVGYRSYYGQTLNVFQCLFCDKQVMLDRHQLRDMPWSLARCRSGVRMTLLQWVSARFFGVSIDCYGKRPTL